jgi:probable O-glycosylation ligase (exosortase A-associated)
LITLVVTDLVLLWHSKRKYLMIPLLIAVVALALVSVPEAWFARMQDALAYGQDPSAQSWLDVWRVGIRNALEFPLTGVGLDRWYYAVVTMDRHNSYVEMMAEHGFVAFSLWCALLLGTIVSLMRLARKAARSPQRAWVGNYGQMLAASLTAYATGSMFLGLSYWDFQYQLVAIAVLLSEFARKAAVDSRFAASPA